MELDRRNFLKGAAVVGGTAVVAGLTGCTPAGGSTTSSTTASTTVPQSWDEEHDIVIVGAGGAGLIAALAATEADSSADIVILEKMATPGGTTIVSGGNIGAMGTDNIKAFAAQSNDPAYQDDTFEMYWQDKLAAGCYLSDPDIARLFAYNSLDNFNWLEGLGIKWTSSRPYENPVEIPSDFSKAALVQASDYLMTYDENGQSTLVNRKVRYNTVSDYKGATGGSANFQCLMDNVATKDNIQIVTNAPVTSIIREEPNSGDVLGVTATVSGTATAIRAKRAVIITAGGYGANGTMLNMYDPRIDPSVQTSGGPGNTGDVMISAQLIGAQTVNMQCIQIDFGGSVKEPSTGGSSDSNPFGGAGDFIDVGKDGKRFWTEKPEDEQFMDAELMTLHKLGYKSWWRLGDSQSVASSRTQDNLNNFAKTYGSVCQSVPELATAIGCDAGTLQQTLDAYNGFVAAKMDTELGKSKTYLTHPINTPPYYVFEATYYCRTTPGGLRINTDAKVLDLYGKPIPRLYAAGEATGNTHGRFRNNGGDSWCDITCFGRISGKNATAETPAS